MILEAFAQGEDKRIGGIISGGSHIIGLQLRKMIYMFLKGKVEEAAKIQQKYLPLFKIMGQNGRTNPCSLLKEAMKMVGYHTGISRLSLSPDTEEEIAEVKRVMKELKII